MGLLADPDQFVGLGSCEEFLPGAVGRIETVISRAASDLPLKFVLITSLRFNTDDA